MSPRLLVACCVALTWGSAAAAQEAMSTAGAAASPPPAAELRATPVQAPDQAQEAQEIGDWARGVLAGAPSREEAAQADRSRCGGPTDGKPHGEVWAGVGTRGYRELGGVVTQAIGKCGSVTLGASHSEGGYGRRGWR
jgi:hypothetical protein